MPTSKTVVYSCPLYFNAVLEKINNATELIEVEMFLMRTGYEWETECGGVL